MTINGITQTYASFSAMRLTINVSAPTAASQPSTGSAASPTDTVTLSPEATAPAAGSGDAATEPSTATPAPSAPPSAAPDRAGALFAALDADQDGAITEDEFKSGAKQLLSRGRGPRRADDDDHDHHDHGHHGMRRLDRKLDKLFDRVDADGNGSIDETELTDALAAADARRQPPPAQSADAGADPAAGQGATSGTVVTFTMTFVSIAVKRYTALQGETPATGAPAGSAGLVTLPPEPAVDDANSLAVGPPVAA